MARRTWILDTDTKGTGARMVPLEEAKPGSEGRGVVVAPEHTPREKERAPQGPRRFRVTDVMTRRRLGEGGTRATVELLKGIRSSVDVTIEVWEEHAGKWQQLSEREKQMLWSLRDRRR